MLNRYEQILAASRWSTLEVCESFAKAAYQARISFQPATEQQQMIWNIGTSVIGPTYTAFVWWILKKAELNGIKRLYFMARDGLILKEIADILAERSEIQIENRNFYVSRQSLLYASIRDIDTFDVRWFMWNPLTPLSTKKIFNRLNISTEQINNELVELKIMDVEKNLSLSEKFRLRKIFNKPTVRSLIMEKAQPQQELAFEYLQQEGLTEEIPFAVVDLGWLALSQYAISRILDQKGKYPQGGVKGYYLGTNWLLQQYKNDTLESFLFDPMNMFWKISTVQYEIPEIFATADIGRTTGYEKQNGMVAPIFGKPNQQALAWGSALQKKAVLSSTREISGALSKQQWNQNIPDSQIRRVFSLFLNFPTQNEAQTYGEFVHGADIEEKEGRKIAPEIEFKDLIKILTGYYWVQGCIQRTTWPQWGRTLLIYGYSMINVLRHLILKIFDRIFV